ncbi:hypothetical protein ACWCQN_37965 [Streptomyces sp. NPDC001984]
MTQSLGHGKTTSAEAFWYVVGCICFGASYFAKIPVRKALSEYGLVTLTGWQKFWYVLMNIALGSGYLSKVIVKKAMSEIHAPVGEPGMTTV